jgi:hypothetical protein
MISADRNKIKNFDLSLKIQNSRGARVEVECSKILKVGAAQFKLSDPLQSQPRTAAFTTTTLAL